MAIPMDEEGNLIKPFVIVEASSAIQLEQRILDFMSEGYEIYGNMSISPKGVYVQSMIRARKIARV